MTGTVVTFYSYKGGVGRSFALVNVGALLGRWGFRVLCIDWDLEAPGLEDFFRPYFQSGTPPIDSGVVELLTDFARTRQVPLEWRDCVQTLHKTDLPNLDFIKAGRFDSDYMSRLQRLNWDRLYKHGLGEALETMFDELRSEYDFILIDSRTGVTDFSGIVTAQLPDILAFLFTANEQSLGGATSVAKRAVSIRNDLAIDRSRLLLLPIPARFESQVEHIISQNWRSRFASALVTFYDGWANKELPIERLIQAATIPYVPFWSFGERISVIEDPIADTSSINFSMENIAALLAHKLGQTRLLIESRDEYLGAARRLAGRSQNSSVFLSYSLENEDSAAKVLKAFAHQDIEVLGPDQNAVGSNVFEKTKHLIERASHFVALFGPDLAERKSIYEEIRFFLRQVASDEAERSFIPILLPGASINELPSFIRNYRFVQLNNDAKVTVNEIMKHLPPQRLEQKQDLLSLELTSAGAVPVAGAQVCALAENGTILEAISDEYGRARLNLATGKSYQILVAHPSFLPVIKSDFLTSEILALRLRHYRNSGSLIMQSTGCIPGLNGRLNAILDTSGRTYLYAENIAINGGKKQPANFRIDEPLLLEDNAGALFRAVVRIIKGRTTLLEYEHADSSLKEMVALGNRIERAIKATADRVLSNDARYKGNARNLQWWERADMLSSSDKSKRNFRPIFGEFWETLRRSIDGEELSPQTINRAMNFGMQALHAFNQQYEIA
ncbi:TIR domain-containing protein [Rhizobium leguminosarum]|uniref:KGGVGR-motif variant AAA ATPase n=1 Tax=Rhizobium leguminosarum TaxID=384 RepID=UPI000FEC9B61|nr:TIR domain-containing protein [Rhizobium leguminosarum]RWX19234.1 TIR domain-containing protein [Rhizobium leguminosarum]